MEYCKESFALNFLCEFRDRGIESDFKECEKLTRLAVVRFMMLFLGFAFAMFAIADIISYGNGSAFIISIGLRGIGLLITIAVFFAIGKIKRFENTLLLISVTELLVFAIYLIHHYIVKDDDKGRDLSLQLMAVFLFIGAAFLIPNSWKNSLVTAVLMWASYIIFCLLIHDPGLTPTVAQRGLYLGTFLMACTIFLFGRESSERRHFAAEKLLEFMTITDKLTGIFNRSRFEYVLGLWIKNMRHDPFCLILFDIDDFKNVNDRYGHVEGDHVLVSTVKTVNASIRDNDVFSRWGGEEFVILFSRVSIEKATELAERIRKAVENNDCGPAGKITISIGVAQYHRGESIPDFVNRADAKMYEAKKAGKNCVVAEVVSAGD